MVVLSAMHGDFSPPHTVEFHRANIMQKLSAKTTSGLVRKVVWRR
jgi:DNA-binding CsgD family transcriptional regulator